MHQSSRHRDRAAPALKSPKDRRGSKQLAVPSRPVKGPSNVPAPELGVSSLSLDPGRYEGDFIFDNSQSASDAQGHWDKLQKNMIVQEVWTGVAREKSIHSKMFKNKHIYPMSASTYLNNLFGLFVYP